MQAAIKFIIMLITNIINGLTGKWLEMRESRRRGELEVENRMLEDALKRKEIVDGVLDKPIESDADLLDNLRRRRDRDVGAE